MKISDIIELVRELLSGANEEADLLARYIVSEISALSIPELTLYSDKKLTSSKIKKILLCARRKLEGEPLQYIFQKAYFRDLKLTVGPNVLIPRPETEIIVDEIIANLPKKGLFCEVGTGSGAISLATASERPDCSAFASEISDSALKYARQNKRKLKIKNAFFLRGDLFSPFLGKKFDVIAANLPYIKNSQIKSLPCEIRNYEPTSALDGGKDGLSIIKRFFLEAPFFAKENAFIIAEISPEQFLKIKLYLQKYNFYSKIRAIRDLRRKIRFISARISQTQNK